MPAMQLSPWAQRMEGVVQGKSGRERDLSPPCRDQAPPLRRPHGGAWWDSEPQSSPTGRKGKKRTFLPAGKGHRDVAGVLDPVCTIQM